MRAIASPWVLILQARGQVERHHEYWQKRLPARLAADQILELCGANTLLEELLAHANREDIIICSV